ncbi:hypothetical protein TSOC_007518 [Tetrabaena socialis]|uniref:FAD-dependent oxidoreductase domain-containing protein 1 n=1 Tax=Tetrabaena socialis TaxID=47790 RepID=A0A2J8A0U3_9CHLO|nr:hypothetical protein TSOC_007518 [Tetrabaena socialis]|eukprot:PNH06143.1 hypothetical protein TSOC_007518 [Tetrabaena socialis]
MVADVVIVGAGIVGLFAARELLRQRMSVTLLERKGLCAGATGAGQGYLWMAHRMPGSTGWGLAARSIALWRRMVEADEALRSAVEWQDCGSLLVSTTPAESASLSERQLALNDVGLRATYLDGGRLAEAEPALALPRGGAGLLVQADTQINGRAAAHVLLERCRAHEGFRELMGPEAEVQGVELAAAKGGAHVVRTAGGRWVAAAAGVTARHALVLSAGVWSGGLLAGATGEAGWGRLLQPRRGHLLELAAPPGAATVRHGMMEMSYTKPVDITFTATTTVTGSLLIGSSREFSGWDTTPSPPIVAAILQRSALFLPGLQPAADAAAEVAAAHASGGGTAMPYGRGGAEGGVLYGSGGGGSGGALAGLSVRVGLRPYATGGLPLVGPVEGAPGLFVAAGHEGSGLCMGPATGELLSRHIRKHMAATSGEGAGGGDASLDTRSFDELLPDVRRRAALAAPS